MSTLYLVATPLGNLEDITLRAIRLLREVTVIAAEDTRHTRRLLTHFDIVTPLVSYHAHNERSRRMTMLAALERGDVALVSDAGSPAVADPGFDLVNAAWSAGHAVSPVPGPSAMIAAASMSGLVPGGFVALGFLPRKTSDRTKVLGRAAAARLPMVIYEAPTRLGPSLRDLHARLGNRPAVIVRELTKFHEERIAGTLDTLATRFEREVLRGEIVIVVDAVTDLPVTGDEACAIVTDLVRSGLSPSQAARDAAAICGRPRSEVYELARRIATDLRGSSDR